jgi:hypothetical protein
MIAGISGSISGSSEITVAMTWTSLVKPFGNSGRNGRSIRRQVSVSFSDGPAFAFEEAARDLAGRVGAFLVVDRQGEEITPRITLLFRHCCDQNHRFTHADHDGATRLSSHFAGFQYDLVVAVLKFFLDRGHGRFLKII